MLQVKGQGEIFPGQDFDRGRRSTYSVSQRDTPLPFTLQQQAHRWDVPFGVPMSVHPMRLVFSFIFNQAACLLLHATKPYRGVNFPYQHFL